MLAATVKAGRRPSCGKTTGELFLFQSKWWLDVRNSRIKR